jgi:cytoskeletal protein RodZ
MGGLGAYLRSAREQRGLDIRDVALQTRISITFLKALEEEDFSKLPGEVFVKGFLKNYGRFLNLPEEEVMKRFAELKPGGAAAPPPPAAPSPAPEPAPAEAPESAPPSAGPRQAVRTRMEPFIWAAVILAGLVTFVVMSLPPKHPVGEEPAPPAAGAPVLESAGTGTEAAAKPEKLYLDIVALEDTWVLVRTDSSPQKKAVLKKGESVTWSADERFLLSYANVGSARLVLNGKELTVTGPKTAVVRDLTITASGIVLQKIELEKPKLLKPKPAQPPAPAAEPPAQPQPQTPAPEQPAPAPEPASPPPAPAVPPAPPQG